MHTTLGTRIRQAVLLLAVGLLLSPWSIVYAQEQASFMVSFDPYFIGQKQQDLVLVENFGSSPVAVRVEASDPISGKLLDSREIVEVTPGGGGLVRVTDTIPQAHASRLMVLIRPLDNNPPQEQLVTDLSCPPRLPIRVTRLLVTDKLETVLQVKGQVQQVISEQGV